MMAASDDLKALVTREIASGSTIAEVARRHGYTWKGMKRLVEQPDVQQLIRVERQRIRELGEHCRARLFQLGPEALEIIAEVIANRRHPKRLATALFVVEKILPTRTMVEAGVNAGASRRDLESQPRLDDTLIQMAHHLKALRDAQAGRHPLSRVVTAGAETLSRPALPDGRDRR
jgi:transposase-like protein